MKKIIIIFFLAFTRIVAADGYNVFSIGYYDVKFDGSNSDDAADFRYENRFDKSLLKIGPESYDFFDLKPFAGIEVTGDSASYLLAGIYLVDNAGTLFTGNSSNFFITPSFGAGIYDNGNGIAAHWQERELSRSYRKAQRWFSMTLSHYRIICQN